MLAKNENGQMVEVPAEIAKLAESVPEFSRRKQVVKAACGLLLPDPPAEEQILGTGEWKQYTPKRGNKTEHLYASVGGATLPDGTVANGVFIRSELVPALIVELTRLMETKPA